MSVKTLFTQLMCCFYFSRPPDFCSGPGAHRGGPRHKGNAQDAGQCKTDCSAFDRKLNNHHADHALLLLTIKCPCHYEFM